MGIKYLFIYSGSSFTVGPRRNKMGTRSTSNSPIAFTFHNNNILTINRNNNNKYSKNNRQISRCSNTILQKSKNNEIEEKLNEETVMILGGGFGGLYTALTLSTLLQSIPSTQTKMKIKLIDSKERFIFLPLLYELCINKISLDEVAPTYKDLLLGSSIEFIQGDVTSIDTEFNSIQLTNSSLTKTSSNNVVEGDVCMKYDKLVIATGNAPPTINNLESKLKGASTCISSLCTFYTIDDCYDLRRRLTYL